MTSIETLFENLEKWCREQRDLMARANEMMRAGTMHAGMSKDGYTWIDQTQDRIKENDHRIAEIDETLAAVASGKL